MSQSAFFRQSAWMMFANVACGALMFAVHFFSKKIPEAEYAILGTLLALLNFVAIPMLPLQTLFAHQTAAAVTETQRRQLAATVRMVLFGSLGVWLIVAAGAWIWQENLMAMWKIQHPLALWAALLVPLCGLWQPVFLGVLQGRQNFLWLGWAFILNGLTRLGFVAVIVLSLNAIAAGSLHVPGFILNLLHLDQLGVYGGGIMVAAALGALVALLIGAWQGRSALRGPGEPFDWRGWLKRLVPLSLGLGASQFLFSADPMFVQKYFDKDVNSYIAVGTMCRALVMFVGPITAVMFSKIVHSRARAEKTNLTGLTLLLTAALAGLGALCLAVLAPWILRFVFKESFLATGVPLMRWFAWVMLPLALGNVLLNHLLAHSAFRVVPRLVVIVAGYAVALTQFHDSFFTVLKVMAVSNGLFLAVTAWFTWVTPPPGGQASADTPALGAG